MGIVPILGPHLLELEKLVILICFMTFVGGGDAQIDDDRGFAIIVIHGPVNDLGQNCHIFWNACMVVTSRRKFSVLAHCLHPFGHS